MQRLLLPPGEAFERHQNLTMVHQTAALHVNEGKGNQSRLIDDISRGGGPNLAPLWIAVCVINVWAIWCRHLEGQSVRLGHVSFFVSQDGKGKRRRVFAQGTRVERFDCDNDQRRPYSLHIALERRQRVEFANTACRILIAAESKNN